MKASVTPDQTTMTPSWDLVQPSWRLVQKHVESILILYFLPALVIILGNYLLGTSLQEYHHAYTPREKTGLYVYLLGVLWTAINIGPSVLFQLKAVADKVPALGTIYRQGLRYTLRIIGFYILFFLAIAIGFVLLIVPALIVFRRYVLAPYYIVDKNLPVIAAMKASSAASKPVSGFIWGTVGVEIIFLFVGVILQVIPLIGAIIGQLASYVILFLFALRYRQLQPATT